MGSVNLSVQGVSTGERNCSRVTIPLCWKGSSDLQLPLKNSMGRIWWSEPQDVSPVTEPQRRIGSRALYW